MANYSVTDKNKYNKGLLYRESFTMSMMQFIKTIYVYIQKQIMLLGDGVTESRTGTWSQ